MRREVSASSMKTCTTSGSPSHHIVKMQKAPKRQKVLFGRILFSAVSPHTPSALFRSFIQHISSHARANPPADIVLTTWCPSTSKVCPSTATTTHPPHSTLPSFLRFSRQKVELSKACEQVDTFVRWQANARGQERLLHRLTMCLLIAHRMGAVTFLLPRIDSSIAVTHYTHRTHRVGCDLHGPFAQLHFRASLTSQ